MISRIAVLAGCVAIAGCSGSVPDSNPYAQRGVGFGNYDSYQAQRAARDRALETPAISPVSEEQVIASETLGVLDATREGSDVTVAEAPAQEPVPVENAVAVAALDPGNPEISDEQNFDAVSSRETIESDADRLQRQRDSFEVATPQAIPERPSDSGPNIVAYALQTTNQVGQPVYRRSGTVSDTKYLRACAQYSSSDQAQEAFLNSGGPKNDRRGLDPDGDGFACFWDPAPFRTARGG